MAAPLLIAQECAWKQRAEEGDETETKDKNKTKKINKNNKEVSALMKLGPTAATRHFRSNPSPGPGILSVQEKVAKLGYSLWASLVTIILCVSWKFSLVM